MADNSEHNLRNLEQRFPELAEFLDSSPPENMVIRATPSGRPTLIALGPQGHITLHSRFDPVREAAALVRSTRIADNAIIVIPGFGLGYHVQALLPTIKKNTPVVIVETDPDMISIAGRHTDMSYLLDHEPLYFLVGLSVDDVEKRLNRLRIAHAFAPLTLFKLPAVQRLAPAEYSRLEQLVGCSGSDRLARTLIQPRFQNKHLNVLILDSGYFLIREIDRALHVLGHQTRLIHLPDRKAGRTDVVARILSETASFKPDMLLTVNHLGFDEQGILTDILDHLQLPFASWFVDSPHFILSCGRRIASPYGTVFVWDADYLDTVNELGCAHVHYLPLATDTSIFAPEKQSLRQSGYSCPVSFVGDSMAGPLASCLEKLPDFTASPVDIDSAADFFIQSADLTPRRAILQAGLCAPDDRFLPILEQLVTWRATQVKRVETVRALAPLNLTIVGDQGWIDLMDSPGVKVHSPLDYYHDLPLFYPLSGVNLNITSQQMKNGVNQRVFDVPASGGFVLTDYRRQAEALFDMGREMISYHTAEEALDLARFYLAHESERRAVIDRARKRVLAEHTYIHRLQTMIHAMHRDYALN
jgi:spore maturation protein CgeB